MCFCYFCKKLLFVLGLPILAPFFCTIWAQKWQFLEVLPILFSDWIGLFQKKPNGRLRTYFFEKTPGIFHFFTLPPGNSRQNKAPPLQILQNCVTSLGNSKARNQDPWKFHIIFSWSPLEIPLCL